MRKKKRLGPGGPTSVDAHVGLRIQKRRLELDMRQPELASLIGLTFQQLYKYETGKNRVSGSRLFAVARALDVSVDYFFEGLDRGFDDAARKRLSSSATLPIPATATSAEEKSETALLVRAYYDIANRNVRKQVVGTMRALARTDPKSQIHDRPRRGRPFKKR